MDTKFYQQLGRKLKDALGRAMSASDAIGSTTTPIGRDETDVNAILQGGIQQAYRITEKFLQYRQFDEMDPEYIRQDGETIFSAHMVVAEKIWASKGIVFSSYSEPVDVVMDQEMLNFIIIELLDNACRYSPLNGHVRAAILQGDDQPIIEIVNDSASLVSTVEMERIGEPFYRGSNAIDKEYGAGLSLCCIKDILKKYNASMTTTCENGVWQTHVTLPNAVDGMGRMGSKKSNNFFMRALQRQVGI